MRLLLGELRQGALAGLMIESVARAADLPVSEVRRAAMVAGGVGIAAGFRSIAFRVIFWIALGLTTASFFTYGIWPIIVAIGVLVAINFAIQGGRKTLGVMRNSLIDGARQAIVVGVACAIVGVSIGVLTLTGAASNFAGFILEVGARSLFLSLFLTMVVCLILGMGIPTIPNYIITSAIAAPALLKLGVPLIVSHMFVFYFGIMADLTPPVADELGFAASALFIAWHFLRTRRRPHGRLPAKDSANA